MTDEVELKYAVADPDALATFLDGDGFPGLDPSPWRELQIEDRYIDTADGRLRAAGYGARLRRSGESTLLTVKTLDNGSAKRGEGKGRQRAALHRRLELEAPAGPGMDPYAWPESDARALLLEAVGDNPLEVPFVLRQVRRERELRRDGSTAVLSMDRTQVRRDRERLGRFHTLEVELRDGDEALLLEVADDLERSRLVEAETRTKEQIAREMIAARRRLPPVPESPGVRADDPLSEAGRKVLAMHLARMLQRESGTRDGRDIEELHKMRVATRRMRAVWRVFAQAYVPKRMKRYVSELREVAATLGAVRDLDVLTEGLEAYAARNEADRAWLEPLFAEWRRRREAARVVLLRELDSGGYTRFVDDYLAFVGTPGAGAAPVAAGAPHRVRQTVASLTWAAYEQVAAHDGTIAWADITTLHELRITGKRLRYTLESFSEVLGPGAPGLVSRVVDLQDHLGAINDASVAGSMAREFLAADGGRLPLPSAQAIGRYLASREREIGRLRRSLPARWRPLMSPTYRRALGRAVAEV